MFELEKNIRELIKNDPEFKMLKNVSITALSMSQYS